MLSRQIFATLSILFLLLVAAVPVEGTPSLQKGAHSTYSLNVTISFLETCRTFGTTTIASSGIICPMTVTFPTSTNVSGTVTWTVTDLTNAAASLNVTHDLTISTGESTRPVIRNAGSFNESVDLASRLVSLFPGIMPEMDQFLQSAQSTISTSPASINILSSMTTLEGFMPHTSLYTMWWVNGPLKLNETVPILFLPTNVTRASTLDLGGSIGSRHAWTLDFNFSRPIIVPDSAAAAPISIPGGSVKAGFVFNYDNTSDLLLSANADLHSGFELGIPVPPTPCVPTGSVVCPEVSSPTIVMSNFGVSIEASLKLVNTSVDLSHRMTQPVPPQSNGGPDDGSGSGTGDASGTNNGTHRTVSDSNGNGATGSNGQPSSATSQPTLGGQMPNWSLWIYALVGILTVAIVSSAVWISRRRRPNESRTNNQSGQTPP